MDAMLCILEIVHMLNERLLEINLQFSDYSFAVEDWNLVFSRPT